jgi:hypothetical protein
MESSGKRASMKVIAGTGARTLPRVPLAVEIILNKEKAR